MDCLVGTGGVYQSSKAFCRQETGCLPTHQGVVTGRAPNQVGINSAGIYIIGKKMCFFATCYR